MQSSLPRLRLSLMRMWQATGALPNRRQLQRLKTPIFFSEGVARLWLALYFHKQLKDS